MNRRWIVFLILPVIIVTETYQEEDPDIERLKASGAQYLRNVMEKLQHERDEGQSVEIIELTNILNSDHVSEPPDHAATKAFTLRGNVMGPTPAPHIIGAEIRPISPPPPSLTTGELTAIYNAALMKGATLPQLQAGAPPSEFTYTPNHAAGNDKVVQPSTHGVADAFPGYYYYYYPIKSFLQNQMTVQQPHVTAPAGLKPPPAKDHVAAMSSTSSKSVEPLFMAVTGFVSMALMFVVSVLFLPKLGNIRSGDVPELKEAPNELAVFGKLVIESMDGKDCTERIACEVGRVVRRMKLEKPFKILEVILPPNWSRQIGMIRKAATKKEKCNFIPCRFKTDRPPKTQEKKDHWKKGPSPHDLWMKHFEKEKLALKNPSKKKEA